MALARQGGLAEDAIEAIRIGGLLHDIGNVGIPEAILNKPGRLTAEEQAIMRAHPAIGARILTPIAALGAVVPLVRYHHECWDGQGYPEHLAGEAIPIGARIIAICDAYDTMAYDRPYRRGLGHDGAIRQLTAGAGTQFDPELVAAFVTLPIAPLRISTLNGSHRRDEPRESLAIHQARSIHVR